MFLMCTSTLYIYTICILHIYFPGGDRSKRRLGIACDTTIRGGLDLEVSVFFLGVIDGNNLSASSSNLSIPDTLWQTNITMENHNV